MPSSNNHGSPMPFASFRRPILAVGSDQVHSEMNHDSSTPNLDTFQRQVFTWFHDISVVDADEFLSISWICKLLASFTSCHDHFQAILLNNRRQLLNPPADRLATEFFDRVIKALDIFNATRDGIEKIRIWQKHLEIIVCALDTRQRILGSIFSNRNRSFGRKGKDSHHHRSSGHSRSLSWSVPHNWSASKQLQLITNNLIPPRGNEIETTDGLATLFFAMSFILMFVLWILVVAIPCQDRGVQIHFTIPRNFPWSTPFSLLHSRIMDESKKRDRRNSNGLLKEIYQIEKNVHQITTLVDSAQFPLPEEVKEEVTANGNDLSLVCEACKRELEPLQRQLRDVFRKIMNGHTEGLEALGMATEP
ncbi:hypothetical protein F511_05369 [Dorcoceras hygrometricum]|uniref:BYPASS-related protein n=1 Tax=Dorcoceras hygrometricum TaxID=472368 RepID=A0A2Z7ATR0_9LAMI|nr:hypothetical protein F511_05369 [Dorcoceras hygrometricum]